MTSLLTPHNALPPAPPFPLNPSGLPASIIGGGGGGSDVNTEVGPQGHWDVGVAGFGFNLDYSVQSETAYRIGYLQQRKEQFDTSKEPGEQSLANDFWRRSRSSWHGGAGQEWLDADSESESSSAIRFNESYGLNVWTKRRISFLRSLEQKKTGASGDSGCLVAYSGSTPYLYFWNGNSLYFTSNPTSSTPTWSTVTGHGSNPVLSVASAGGFVYYASNGAVWKISVGTAGAATSWLTLASVDRIGFANGFMFASADPALYLVSTAPAATAVTPGILDTISTGNFTWIGFCDGPSGPIVAGRAGAVTILFRGVIDATGALDHFEEAGRLPEDDYLYAIISYLNTFVVFGTSRGLRLGQFSGEKITFGPLFGPERVIQALEAQDKFVWFGWSDMQDSASGGLTSLDLSGSTAVAGTGRIDLSIFTDTLVPAYAVDVAIGFSASPAIHGITSISNRRYIAFNNTAGIYGETNDYVATGQMTTGKIRWSTLEKKSLRFVDVFYERLRGDDTITTEVSVEGQDWVTIDTADEGASTFTEMALSESGRWFQLRFTLTRDSSNDDQVDGPVLSGWTARANPMPKAYRFFDITLLLYDRVTPRNWHGEAVGYPGYALYILNQLHELRAGAEPFLFQGQDYGVLIDDEVQTPVYTCVIDDIVFEQRVPGGGDRDNFGGRCRVLLREVG